MRSGGDVLAIGGAPAPGARAIAAALHALTVDGRDHLAIAGQLLLSAWQALTPLALTGTVATHLFTFGAMGCVIPAMIVRIGNGHTGRKVVFAAEMILITVLWFSFVSFVLTDRRLRGKFLSKRKLIDAAFAVVIVILGCVMIFDAARGFAHIAAG